MLAWASKPDSLPSSRTCLSYTVDALLPGKADEQPRTAMLFILWMYVLSPRHYFLINVHTGKQINQKDLKQALFVLHEQTAIALCLNLIVKNEQFW